MSYVWYGCGGDDDDEFSPRERERARKPFCMEKNYQVHYDAIFLIALVVLLPLQYNKNEILHSLRSPFTLLFTFYTALCVAITSKGENIVVVVGNDVMIYLNSLK